MQVQVESMRKDAVEYSSVTRNPLLPSPVLVFNYSLNHTAWVWKIGQCGAPVQQVEERAVDGASEGIHRELTGLLLLAPGQPVLCEATERAWVLKAAPPEFESCCHHFLL